MIIGKPITALGGGGLKPQIIVTAPTGSTVTCDSVVGTEVSGIWTFDVELGSHTIVATDGSNTKTETVLVDEIKQYEITISFLLYLYNLGDECTAATGGWIAYPYGVASGYTALSAQKNSDNIYMYEGGGMVSCAITTNNKIDITNYSKLSINFAYSSSAISQNPSRLGFRNSNTGYYENDFVTGNRAFPTSGSSFTVDISSYSGSYYFLAGVHYSSNTALRLYQVWLE